MQHIENIGIINTTESFNIAKKICEKHGTITKYTGLALAKASIILHNNLYLADKPKDSMIKRKAKQIGRTFFNVVKAIDAKFFFTCCATTLTISIGIANNYISTESEARNNHANFLIYFGKISLANIISCRFFNLINKIRINIILVAQINHLMEVYNFYTENLIHNETTNQNDNELNETEAAISHPLLNQLSEFSNRIHDNLSNFSTYFDIDINEMTTFISYTSDEIRGHIMDLSHTINSVDITSRKDNVIAYEELKLYDGNTIDPKTLSIISHIALKDTEKPVICEKQLYEYEHLVTWYKTVYPNTDSSCPHNRNKLIWSNVLRVEK